MKKSYASGSKYKVGDIVLCIKTPPESKAFKEGVKARVEETISSTPNTVSKLCFRVLDESGRPTTDWYCYWAADDDCYTVHEEELETFIREEARKLRGLT